MARVLETLICQYRLFVVVCWRRPGVMLSRGHEALDAFQLLRLGMTTQLCFLLLLMMLVKLGEDKGPVIWTVPSPFRAPFAVLPELMYGCWIKSYLPFSHSVSCT